jgi:carotenoid cleavage dioxygenase-like enzyme
MVDFTSMTSAVGYFRPARFEGEIFDCEVSGEIPSQLRGAFYRLHPDWLYPPSRADDIPLAADGYVSAFRFRDGRVDYRGRYVRTRRYEAQRAAGRQLYGYYRNPFTDDPSVRDESRPHLRTTANTTPLVFAGRLYATKEDGLPHELDPNTLETRGTTDFDGRWASQTFTAHAKIDPISGEMAAFGYEAAGLCTRDVFLALFDRTGRISREWRFEVPYTSMLHDMCLTREHVIIPGGGSVTSLERLKAGKLHWAWDSSRPSYYGIIPRDGDERDIRWFFGPERSIVHTANARTEGSKVIMDAPMADGNTWPWFEDLAGGSFRPLPNIIRRITFDLNSRSDRATEEILFEQPVTSFTRIDERFLGLPYRYIYVQYFDSEHPARAGVHPELRYAANSFGRFDTRTGELRSCFLGETHIVQEPTFVPRPGSSEEGDGWLLGTAHNPAEMRSELAIVDAPSMQEVARVILPFRTPSQVHGAWADSEQLPLS